jgi:uncharacterized repeat protein (TIGR01451 family)
MENKPASSSHFLIWILALLITLALGSVAQAQTFSDATFNNASWNSVLLPISVSGSSFTASQDNVNGNGIPSRITTHSYPMGQIFVAHLSTTSTYDPASQGAIVNLSYSYDLRHYTTGQVAYYLLVFQNNTWYVRTPNDLITSPGGWMNFSGLSLTAASFIKLTGPSPNVNPDFSCNGSRIVFGYATRNSNPTGNLATTRSGIDNWRVTITEKRQCCGTISEPRVTCDRGVFTYTFTVTNTSSQQIQYLLLSPPASATFTVSPTFIDLGANPLNNNQSTTISVNITNASPQDHICINVALADKYVVPCCTIQTCVDLPDCPCLRLVDSSILCGPQGSGSYTYTVTLRNLTGLPVQQIFIVPTLPSNMSVSPQQVTLSTPLLPNQQTTLTLTITGVAPGTTICLRFAPLSDDGATCCSTEQCITLPNCPVASSPNASKSNSP